MNRYGLTGEQYHLDDKPFSCGGEGNIHIVLNQKEQVAKLYHAGYASEELEAKLKLMVQRPPGGQVLSQIAWPLDVLYDEQKTFVGFVMPKLDITDELIELYKYPPARYKHITMKQKLIVAENICAVISGIHKAGYVFGDFNPHNIGVNLHNGRVAFFDTDSYHINDEESGETYRCKVCLDGYVAPELLRICEPYPKDAYALAPLPTFTKQTDNFALAIHIFRLLMNGYTPFNGIRISETASTASPGVGNLAVKRGSYCFKPGNKPQASAVLPAEALPYEINDLFTRAFLSGRYNPQARPSAAEWHAALLEYEKQLRTCQKNRSHQYMKTLETCPYCAADKRYAASLVMPPARSVRQEMAGADNYTRTNASSVTQNAGKQKKRRALWIAGAAVLIFAATMGITSLLNGNDTEAASDASSSYSVPVPTTSSDTDTSSDTSSSSTSSGTTSDTSSTETPQTISGTTFGGTITSSDTADSYRYTAQTTGTYTFKSAIQSSNFRISFCVADASGVTILDTNLSSSYQQTTVNLTKGQTYAITVSQSKGYGSYSMSLTAPQTATETTTATAFSGTFTYDAQKKTEEFKVSSTGTYLFTCDTLSEDTVISMKITDGSGNIIVDTEFTLSGDEIGVPLTAGMNYTVTISQTAGYGSYSVSYEEQ